jgi:hypothetical protein
VSPFVFVVGRTLVPTKLATSLGKKEDQSATMASKLPVPSEVDPQNIARPNVEQTSAEE